MARTCDSTRPATLRVAALAFLVLGATLTFCSSASAQNTPNARGTTPPNAPSRAQEQRKPFLSGLFSSPQQRPSTPQAGQAQRGAAIVPQTPTKAQIAAQRQAQQSRQPQSQRQPLPSVFSARPQAPNARDFHANSQHISAGGAPSFAPQSPDALMRASTSPQDAREALAKIPWDAFPPATREKLQTIASAPTLYRRLPMAGCRCNPELFDFFLTYPNAVVELWKQMGYDDIDMKSFGNDRYTLTEKPGSAYSIQLLYQDSELAIAYGAGSYRGPASLMRPVEGEALVVLQTRYTEGADLTPVAICRLDAFVVVKNPGVDLLARTLNSAFGKVADQNFEQTMAFIDSVSQTAETSPMEFNSMIANLGGLSPEARRVFAAKAQATAREAVARSRGEVVDYSLLAKRNAPNPSRARILSRGDSDRNVAARRPLAPPSGGNEFGAATGFASSNPGGALPNAFAPESFASSRPRAPSYSPAGMSSDEFSLADDEGEIEFEWDSDETLMTGEDFLASQGVDNIGAPTTVNSDAASLARVGAKPTSKPIAAQILDDGEKKFAASTPRPIGSSVLSTDGDSTDAFSLDDSDGEIYIDAEEEDEPAPPTALNVATKRPPNLPITPHSLRAPGAAHATAAPLASAEASENADEEEDLAEVSIGEDGEIYLVFPDEDTDDADANDADLVVDALEVDSALEPSNPSLAPYAAEFVDGANVEASEIAKEAEKEKDELDRIVEEDLGANWTRASFASPRNESRPIKKAVKKVEKNVEKNVKKLESNVKKVERKIQEEIPTMDRPRIVTKRYAPRSADDSFDGQVDLGAGEPVSTFKQAPRPAAKTAALPSEPEESPAVKLPTFKRPDLM